MKKKFIRAWNVFCVCFWTIVFLCICLVSTPSYGSDAIKRVVRQYALTSANDFPQRDPFVWRLLGSNDGGTNWELLDIRHNEVFPERHQRRLFKISNTKAFNVYRLEIIQSRDPANANSVQLAEIELLGETENDLDPTPCNEDLILVQGENPSVETRFQAFDNRVETKWVDFANDHPDTRSSWIQWQYVSHVDKVVTNINELLGLRAHAKTGCHVEMDCVFVDRLFDTNVVCLLDGTGYLETTYSGTNQFYPGQRLHLVGTSRWTEQQVSLEKCELIPLNESRGEPQLRHISLGQAFSVDEANMQWVEAEGTVQFASLGDGHFSFELSDHGQRLTVRVLHLDAGGKLPSTGDRVCVRGICNRGFGVDGKSVAMSLLTPSLKTIFWVMRENVREEKVEVPHFLNGAGVLTNISQIRQFNPHQLTNNPRVRIRGVVTEAFGEYIQDETGGIELLQQKNGLNLPVRPKMGTFLEVSGVGSWVEGHGPAIQIDQIRVLGNGKLPSPKRPGFKEISSGNFINEWIEIEGVVRSTDGSHMLLICDGGRLMATIRSASVLLVKGLVDATVRIRGVNVSGTDDRGRILGVQLLVPSLDYIEVIRASEDPFALPTRTIASLSQVGGLTELSHCVKVEGVLTLSLDHKLFIQDATGSAMAIKRGDVLLNVPQGAYYWAFYQVPGIQPQERWGFEPGDKLEVVGFPENREGFSTVLTEALARKTGHGVPITPPNANMEELRMGKMDSTLVYLNAVVLGHEKMGNEWVYEMQSGQEMFQAVLPATNKVVSWVDIGSLVRVCGVCQIEPNPFPELGKKIASFKILLASPSSVVVVKSPPWWTLSRALAIAGGLAVILVMATAWIGILRYQVGVQTSQLKAEIEQHKQAEEQLAIKTAMLQTQIEERKRIEAQVEESHKQLLHSTRMAGMAEMANSVLHNVGNVLNSANMLTSLISEHVRSTKTSTLLKTTSLLSEHRQDLGDFLTHDEHGKFVPELLNQLAANLEENRNRVIVKVDALAESVQHIKEIISMQQKYARVSTPTEKVMITEVVDDALRLSSAAFARGGIFISRQYETKMVMDIDRHKLLQILFNLLENARHACAEDRRSNRQVTILVSEAAQERVRISVADNGVGIAAEYLPRLFSQGFFIRKDGHGFGLHSSALAAQDMGGTLSVQSDGLGKGAVFILEIPLNPISE